MKLTICKQAWNEGLSQDVTETWELRHDGTAEVTFSKSPTGSFYTEVWDRKRQETIVPNDGQNFLNALHARLKKTPFTRSFMDS